MQTYIDKAGIDTLREVIGQNIQSITAENWKKFNRSYGNLLIQTSKKLFVIDNDYRVVSRFGDEEEIAGFSVSSLDKKEDFIPSVLQNQLLTEKTNELILSVCVVRDKITVKFIDNRPDEIHIIDQAIIFIFEKYEWLIGQSSWMTPMTKMLFGNDLISQIPNVETVAREWTDEAESPDHPIVEYQATVDRDIIQLN